MFVRGVLVEDEEKGGHDPVGIDVRDVENVHCLLKNLLKDDDASVGEWIVGELNGERLSSVQKWEYVLDKLAGKRHTFVKVSWQKSIYHFYLRHPINR
jgi:hypothetical protein